MFLTGVHLHKISANSLKFYRDVKYFKMRTVSFCIWFKLTDHIPFQAGLFSTLLIFPHELI